MYSGAFATFHDMIIPGGGYSEKLSRGVWPASQYPIPIYDQNSRFSLSFLRLKSTIFPTFMTKVAIFTSLGGKMAKIDTLFMTQTAEKPYPLAPHIPIQPI